MISNKDYGTGGAHSRPTANAEIGPSLRSLRHSVHCTRVTTACRTRARMHIHATSKSATPSYAGFTHARDAAAAAAVRCTIMRSSEERQRERGRERERMRDTRAREKARQTEIRAVARGNFAVQLSPAVCCLPFAENIRNSSVVTTRRRSICERPTAFPSARYSVPELPVRRIERYSVASF